MRIWLVACLVLCLNLAPSSSFALGKGEASLSGGLGFSVVREQATRPAANLEVRLLRGISDSWAGRLSAQGVWIPASGGGRASFFTVQDLGLTWAMDALNLVPFVDLGVLVADIRGGGARAVQRLGGRAGGGADYIIRRRLALSVSAHFDYLAIRLAGGQRPRPIVANLALYLTVLF